MMNKSEFAAACFFLHTALESWTVLNWDLKKAHLKLNEETKWLNMFINTLLFKYSCIIVSDNELNKEKKESEQKRFKMTL